MITLFLSSVVRRRSVAVWALFCVLAGATFLAYTLTSLANAHGVLVMPLDDVYIHFQYARQMAVGQPYIYNPGFAPTSGATSFLYPYVLAIGYVLGFQGLNLGLWAMGVGALALLGSMCLVYQLIRLFAKAGWLAVPVAVAFGVSGPVAWHFMSGMETGLVILFALGTLYSSVKIALAGFPTKRSVITASIWATALALIRPEGGLLAVVAAASIGWIVLRRVKPPQRQQENYRHATVLLLPIVAVGIQPLVNLLLTGSAVASGNSAKSVLGGVPFYADEVIRRILGNFLQIWVEIGTGISPREGLYILPLFLFLSLMGLVGLLLAKSSLRTVGVMLVLWLFGGTAMLATLDTVFWHFKRYQMPFIALLFPLAGWGLAAIHAGRLQSRNGRDSEMVSPPDRLVRRIGAALRGGRQPATYLIIGLMLLTAVFTGAQFWRYYGVNVGYVYAQPLQMAHWLEANTPENAVVAVHDVGMMRYMGGRTTLDLVGLTTKGAADYWRNGPGAVAEFLLQEHPNYIASYGFGHGYGLGMIADTDIYGEPLVGFPVALDNTANVALAADFQGIYKPDWAAINEAKGLALQASICDNYFLPCKEPPPQGIYAAPTDSLDVGNLADETKHHYQWADNEPMIGFPTEVHEFDYLSCYTVCKVTDGGRRIDQEESFDITGTTDNRGDEMLLITRVHPAASGTIDVYANGHFVATRWIPELAGYWLEIPTLIPAEYLSINPEKTHIRIVPHVPNNYYMPYNHVAYFYHDSSATNTASKPQASFQEGLIQLQSAAVVYQQDAALLNVDFDWYSDGKATGDYKVFVHLYADTDAAPVAQTDMRPGNGTLPPGNWLPGVLRDTITVDLSEVPPGTYQVAIGMYDPISLERLKPTGGDGQGRLFIGEVEIPG